MNPDGAAGGASAALTIEQLKQATLQRLAQTMVEQPHKAMTQGGLTTEELQNLTRLRREGLSTGVVGLASLGAGTVPSVADNSNQKGQRGGNQNAVLSRKAQAASYATSQSLPPNSILPLAPSSSSLNERSLDSAFFPPRQQSGLHSTPQTSAALVAAAALEDMQQQQLASNAYQQYQQAAPLYPVQLLQQLPLTGSGRQGGFTEDDLDGGMVSLDLGLANGQPASFKSAPVSRLHAHPYLNRVHYHYHTQPHHHGGTDQIDVSALSHDVLYKSLDDPDEGPFKSD